MSHPIHGMHKTRVYRSIWSGMNQRCHSPTAKDFPRYGGNGIAVCGRWRHDFMAFYADMGNPPTARHSIDRIDNAKGYEPSNCRWATPQEQTRNRRCAVRVMFNGEDTPLIEVSRLIGVKYVTLHARIFRFKWPLEKALTVPTHKGRLHDLQRH